MSPPQHRQPPSKRRIAIVLPGLSARGGLASVALFLYRTIAGSHRYEAQLFSLATSSADDHSVRLLSPRSWRRGIRISPRQLDDIPYLHVGTVGAELEPFRYRSRAALTELLKTFDLVQLVAGTPSLAHVARHAKRPIVLQCATMVTVERRALLDRERGLARVWRQLMTALVARMDESGLHYADLVLVENAWMRERVAAAIGPDRVRFSPPGVDTILFHPSGEPAPDVVLAVGRLDDPRKNIAMLLRAFAIAQSRIPRRLSLVLAGHRPLDDRLTALATELGIADAIDARLSPSVDELASLYRSATVFALSSDEEGLGIVVLEAMASGTPVVATRCGGPETSVIEGHTGFLVPIDDASAFADRLVRLLSDAAMRRSMGAAARAHVVRTFSLQRTGEAFLKAYDDLLDGLPVQNIA